MLGKIEDRARAMGVVVYGVAVNYRRDKTVILCWRREDNTWITWVVYRSPIGISFNHGHYDMDYSTGRSDFDARVKEHTG